VINTATRTDHCQKLSQIVVLDHTLHVGSSLGICGMPELIDCSDLPTFASLCEQSKARSQVEEHQSGRSVSK